MTVFHLYQSNCYSPVSADLKTLNQEFEKVQGLANKVKKYTLSNWGKALCFLPVIGWIIGLCCFIKKDQSIAEFLKGEQEVLTNFNSYKAKKVIDVDVDLALANDPASNETYKIIDQFFQSVSSLFPKKY